MITTAYDCPISIFRKCKYDHNYELLGQGATEETFAAIYIEYVDLSGLGTTKQVQLEAKVAWYNNRCERMKNLLFICRSCVVAFGKPFDGAIEDIKEYGHKLYWDGDGKTFEVMLNKVESKEKKYIVQLTEAQHELDLFIKEQIKGNRGNVQNRQEFTHMIITLRSNGYVIDNEKTNVEELALMIKDNQERAEKMNVKK